MDSGHHQLFPAQERSFLAVLKKDIHALAVEAGFPESRIADMDIAVSEICSNLVKHAVGGELLVRSDDAGIEIIALDTGPGMSDVRRMSEDGVSTTSTLGQGLGAIIRLSDFFDIYSIRGWGTVAVCRFQKPAPLPHAAGTPEVRSIVVAKPGQKACGDGVAVRQTPTQLRIFLGDGLGHGPEAQEVVTRAEAAFAASTSGNPADVLRDIHQALRRSRGLVATVAIFEFSTRTWRISGIGNIGNWIGNGFSGKPVMSYNGIVGVNIPNSIGEHGTVHEHGQVLVLSSDGLRTRIDLQKYPGILKHDFSIIAAAIFKDLSRRTDDMSILVARIPSKL